MRGAVAVFNRQRRVRVDLRWLRIFAPLALCRCREISANARFALQQLAEVEIAIVSDRVIAQVHAQFMNIPGTTDVITFEHGEIVLSAETARVVATEHGHPIEEELALYIVHGLLHLNGFEDATPAAAARMQKVQARVLAGCLGEMRLAVNGG